MSNYKFNSFVVSTQAITSDFKKNDGDYDNFLEYGTLNPEQLLEILEKTVGVIPLVPTKDQDFCPPCVVVDVNNTTYSFCPDGNAHYCIETDQLLSPLESLMLASGEVNSQDLAGQGSSDSYSSGGLPYAPVQKPHLKPSNTMEIDASRIDISQPSVKQISYKNSSARQNWIISMICGIVFFLPGGIILGITETKGDYSASGILLFLGIFCIWFSFPLKKWAKEIVSAGFNWEKNIFWYHRPSQKNTGYEENANCIESFSTDLLETMEDTGEDIEKVKHFRVSFMKKGNDKFMPIHYLTFATQKETEDFSLKLNSVLFK